MKKSLVIIVFLCLASILPFRAALAQQEENISSLPAGSTVEEQKPLPALELNIEAPRDQFKLGQRIEFDLVLTNKSQVPLKVFKIDDKSTFCSFNAQAWGTKAVSGDPVVVLMPGENIRKKFKLSSPLHPGELLVNCSYGMGPNKVRPQAKKALNIVR